MNKLGQSLLGTAKPTLLHSQSYWHHSLCCATQLCNAGPESAALVSGTCHLCIQSFTTRSTDCVIAACWQHIRSCHLTQQRSGCIQGAQHHPACHSQAVCILLSCQSQTESHCSSTTPVKNDSCMTLSLHTILYTATARQKPPAKLHSTARWQASAREQARPICAYGPPASILFSLAAEATAKANYPYAPLASQH